MCESSGNTQSLLSKLRSSSSLLKARTTAPPLTIEGQLLGC